MSVQLLDKTRKINKLLHNNHSARVEFNDMCAVLSGMPPRRPPHALLPAVWTRCLVSWKTVSPL